MNKYDSYINLFEKVNGEKIVGESTPIYIYSNEAPSKIHDFNPEAQILIVLREPVSYLHSLHSQYLLTQYEREQCLLKALQLEEKRKKGFSIPKKASHPSTLFYQDKIKYYRYIEKYYACFNPQNIKIMLFDDLVADPKAFLQHICDFLDVSPFTDLKLDHQNPRSMAKSQFIHDIKLHIKNTHFFQKIDRVLPHYIHKILEKTYKSIFYIKHPKDKLSQDLVYNLKICFKPYVEQTAKTTHIDLMTKWDYHNI